MLIFSLCTALVAAAAALPEHLQGIPLQAHGQLNKNFRQELLLGGIGEEGDTKELREKIKELIRLGDKDGDGRLSMEELLERVRRNTLLHVENSRKEASHHLKVADGNGDGKVSWPEYETFFIAQEKMQTHAMTERVLGAEATQRVEEERRSFSRADEDGDGLLDSGEWLQLRHPEQSPRQLDALAAQLLTAFDSNKDGVISKAEFTIFPGQVIDESMKKMEEEERKQREREFVEDIDRNGDGKATLQELREYVDARNAASARREVRELLSLVDEDGDGSLSEAELLSRDFLLRESSLVNINSRLHSDL